MARLVCSRAFRVQSNLSNEAADLVNTFKKMNLIFNYVKSRAE